MQNISQSNPNGVRKAKTSLLIALTIMIVGIVTSFYLYLKLQNKEKEVLAKNIALKQAQDSLVEIQQILTIYKDSLSSTLSVVNNNYVASRDTALSNRINTLVINSKALSKDPIKTIFSSTEASRKLALQQLLDHELNDPVTVKNMIIFGVTNIDDVKGTVNVLYYLNKNNPEILRQFKTELTGYLDLVDKQTGRQQAKGLSAEIRKKL